MAHQQQQQLAPSVNCSLDDIDLTALKHPPLTPLWPHALPHAFVAFLFHQTFTTLSTFGGGTELTTPAGPTLGAISFALRTHRKFSLAQVCV
uniref:HDC08109 n=1 Tax=Drosophila melanogaster TaxID=7227 RepID=Q6ILY2_DROME|nr:TPA_inf: HDC08109 [Drosophila melanogaster]